tara:strand:+ start:524 stop:1342 length:819 start_codon:yes stop_codon:yes gene_type:complete
MLRYNTNLNQVGKRIGGQVRGVKSIVESVPGSLRRARKGITQASERLKSIPTDIKSAPKKLQTWLENTINPAEVEPIATTEKLLSYLNTYGEPLITHSFSVLIHKTGSGSELIDDEDWGPNTYIWNTSEFNNEEITKMCLFACRSATFPGKALSTYQWTTHGAEKDYPYISTYENIDLSFMCSTTAHEREFFDGWMNEIIGVNSHTVAYKDEYVCDIDIALHKRSEVPEKMITAKLINAYPVSISGIELSQDEGQPVEFTVSFAYDKWHYTL